MKYGIVVNGTIISNEKILEEAMKIMAENVENDTDVCEGLECEKCAFKNKNIVLDSVYLRRTNSLVMLTYWKFRYSESCHFSIIVTETYEGIRVYFLDNNGEVDWYDSYWSQIDDYKKMGLITFIEQGEIEKIEKELF